jgi:hypothetical protein
MCFTAIYIQYTQSFIQSRLSQADYALLVIISRSTDHLICHFHNKYTTPVQSVHTKRRNTSFYHTTFPL